MVRNILLLCYLIVLESLVLSHAAVVCSMCVVLYGGLRCFTILIILKISVLVILNLNMILLVNWVFSA